jgi:hypothetical protein
MPRNTLTDLNNHLFAQLERLNDEELDSEKLQEEISRAKAVANIATQIILNGSLVLKSQEFIHEHGLIEHKGNSERKKFPPMLRAEFLGE